MLANNLRPLSLAEILDRTFTLYRQSFLLFFGISAIPHLVSLGFGLFQLLFLTDSVTAAAGGRPANPFANSGPYALVLLLSAIVGVVVYLFSQGATILAVTEIYLGRMASLSTSLSRVWEDFGSLLGVVILNGMAVGIGMLLLLVPGFYLSCRLLVCLPASLIEKLGPRESLSRSFDLTRDNAGRAFVIFLIFLAISLGAGGIIALPGVIAGVSHKGPEVIRIWSAVTLVLQYFSSALVTPILLIATSVFYFDLRIRKEAFDLQFMMDPTSEHISQVRAPGSIL